MVVQLAGLNPSVHSYQSNGFATTVTHIAAGLWAVRLGGFTAGGGTVQLTQYLETGNVGHGYCALDSFGPDLTGTVVNVRCWNDNWTPSAEVTFGVQFNNSKVLPASQYEAFTLASGSFTGSLTPPASAVINHAPLVTHTSVGHYTVEYQQAAANPFPLATALSSTPKVCNIVDWSVGRSTLLPGITARFVRVACFDFAGVAKDTGFTFLMASESPLGAVGPAGGKVLTTKAMNVWTTPATDNLNTTGGTPKANNSFLSTFAYNTYTTDIAVPGFPGGFGLLFGADTLESVGDDGTRCSLEDPPVQRDGSAHLLVFCTDPKGVTISHVVHGGTWNL